MHPVCKRRSDSSTAELYGERPGSSPRRLRNLPFAWPLVPFTLLWMRPDRAQPVRLPELSELQTFVLAIEEGSIARAAERLRISGTAAAKRVRNLEALAGRELLDRSSRGVQPTSHGRALYRRAVHSVVEAQALGELLSEMRPGSIAGTAGIQALLRAPAPEAAGPRGPTEALDDAERLLVSVFHGVSDALALTTADGRVADVNQAWCRLVGRARDELVGVPSHELGVTTEGHTPLGVVTNTLMVRSGVHIAAIVRAASRRTRERRLARGAHPDRRARLRTADRGSRRCRRREPVRVRPGTPRDANPVS